MKLFKYVFFGLLVVGAILFYLAYGYIYNSNVALDSETKILLIPPGSSYEDVFSNLKSKGYLKNENSFSLVSQLMKYKKGKIPSGRYLIKNDWSNKDLIGTLRSGRQTPVKVTFNNIRLLENLGGEISKYFYIDSASIVQYITSKAFLTENGMTKENVMSLFIPNTYEMFWDYSPKIITERLIDEQAKFWKLNDRENKAKNLNLSKTQTYALASIVEKESNYKPEKKRIAGLYYNRIERGIPLQADPTAVYAHGQATGNYALRRVLNEHLEIDSPYNTYKYAGIPPGPITMPSINSIDAVLNHEKHNYIYMCAKPGYGTQHAFAETLRQHNVNANKYRRWLTKEGIR